MAGKNDKNDKILVWDVPVRFFHWVLVALMATSYFSGRAGGDWMQLHFWSGYAILTLLFFRLAWGFVGSTTARFSSFLKGPSAAFTHVAHFFRKEGPRDVGHNPLGGAMVLVLIFAVLAQVVTGLFTADTDTGMVNGPLALKVADKWVERATDFHAWWINVLLILAGGPRRGRRALPRPEAAQSDRAHDHRPQAHRPGGRAGRARTAARLRVEPPCDVCPARLCRFGLFHRPRGRLTCSRGLAGLKPPL